MDHFQIPKLELMQSVISSIIASGVVIQWTADTMEHTHITKIKTPGRAGNNHSYSPQICRYLNRMEKQRNFSLAPSIHELRSQVHYLGVGPDGEDPDNDSDNDNDNDNDININNVNNNRDALSFSHSSPQPDLFSHAIWLARNTSPSTLLPL